MERILLRHLGGSKTNQADEFPVRDFREIVIGRDPKAAVQYDADREDLVSRQHAKITVDPTDDGQFLITDLNSRNGTFVNKQRITQPARLNPGDVVQLGAGGPEFQFDVDPPPQPAVRPTRLAATPTSSEQPQDIRATRVEGAPSPSEPGKPGIGKATVERLIAQNSSQTRKNIVLGVTAFVLLLALVAGLLIYQNVRSREDLSASLGGDLKSTRDELQKIAANMPLTPTEIASAYTNSVVFIECGWKLIYTPTGGQVYHAYVPNEIKTKEGKQPIIADGRASVAGYVAVDNRTIEPALSLDSKGGPPIGSEHTGSGFTVTSDGFIMTNRHVAATWHTSYQFPRNANPGVLLDENREVVVRKDGTPIVVQAPQEWVPARTKQAGQQLQGGFEGRNDYLDVTFARQQLRIPAQLARISDRHDVAMIKIQVPEPVQKVALLDNYSDIKPGDSAIVLGYPAVSPAVFGSVRSQDVFNREDRPRVVPDPTVTVGHIGRVLRGQSPPAENAQERAIYSVFGDAYQLTINATGGGNSGGPLFNDRGRAVGIFFASVDLDARITFAVPIRYAMELMSATSAPGNLTQKSGARSREAE